MTLILVNGSIGATSLLPHILSHKNITEEFCLYEPIEIFVAILVEAGGVEPLFIASNILKFK